MPTWVGGPDWPIGAQAADGPGGGVVSFGGGVGSTGGGRVVVSGGGVLVVSGGGSTGVDSLGDWDDSSEAPLSQPTAAATNIKLPTSPMERRALENNRLNSRLT